MNTIPKRFIRIWVGNKKIPELFEDWWEEFKKLHPDYEFITIRDRNELIIPEEIKPLTEEVKTCAGLSDILRILALDQLGGIYVDTDVMPLKNFDKLIEMAGEKAFLGRRSKKSFESAVIGSPKGHKGIKKLIGVMPKWFYFHSNRAASVQTGPSFISPFLFGRKDVLHLPPETFYPYDGFMAPKRVEKEIMFKEKDSFSENMYAAHFSNHKWGGNPNK